MHQFTNGPTPCSSHIGHSVAAAALRTTKMRPLALSRVITSEWSENVTLTLSTCSGARLVVLLARRPSASLRTAGIAVAIAAAASPASSPPDCNPSQLSQLLLYGAQPGSSSKLPRTSMIVPLPSSTRKSGEGSKSPAILCKSKMHRHPAHCDFAGLNGDSQPRYGIAGLPHREHATSAACAAYRCGWRIHGASASPARCKHPSCQQGRPG